MPGIIGRPIGAPLSTGASTQALQPGALTDTPVIYQPEAFFSIPFYPDGDISTGTWRNELEQTTNLYASIDETTPDDSDYIRSGDFPTVDVCELSLNDQSLYLFGEPIVVSYRYKKVDTTVGTSLALTVRLMEGPYTIAEWTHTGISTSYVVAEQTLTTAEAQSISNQADLSLEFEATYS